MVIILLAGRGIEVNRPYLGRADNRERHGTGNNPNLLVRFRLHVFCSGSRVGCEGLVNVGGTPAATGEGAGDSEIATR